MFKTIYEAVNFYRNRFACYVEAKSLPDLDAIAELHFEGHTGFAFSIEGGKIVAHA